MKKILKLSLLLGAIPPLFGVSSLMIVSCAHKSSTTMSWSEFKAAATHEKAINIINAIMPPKWKDATEAQLSLAKFQVNDQDEIINVVITRTVSTADISSGTFQISYNAENYDYHNWVTAKKPTDNPNWLRFINKAKAETAANLLSYAKISAAWATLKWTYGNAAQIIWEPQDTAEFDTFGGLNKDDDFNMKGQATADSNNKTITAIISKVGHAGLYDSDPIKAVITFKKDIYNNANWVFSQDTQLQSKAKVISLFNKVVTDAEKSTPFKFDDFQLTNWADISGIKYGPLAKNHSTKTHIIDILNTDSRYVNSNTWSLHLSHSNDPLNNQGFQMKIVFGFVIDRYIDPHQLSVYFDCYFNNKTNANDGVTAFNYTWSGIVL